MIGLTSLSVAKAILFGALAVGTLDLLDAFVFFGIRSGAQPMGILHSIAAGFLGRDAARAGGVPTAIVGLFSHYLVAFSIATVYVLMSRAIPLLRTQWFVCGLVFGVIAYFVMTWFVVPMSNAGNHQITFALLVTPVIINGILLHALGVGLPAAAKHRSSQPRSEPRPPTFLLGRCRVSTWESHHEPEDPRLYARQSDAS